MIEKDETRRITNDELSNFALAAAKTAAVETTTRLFAQLDINVANADEVRKLRDAIDFLYSLKQTAESARHRFWITLVTIISGGMIIAAGQALWSFVRTKLSG